QTSLERGGAFLVGSHHSSRRRRSRAKLPSGSGGHGHDKDPCGNFAGLSTRQPTRFTSGRVEIWIRNRRLSRAPYRRNHSTRAALRVIGLLPGTDALGDVGGGRLSRVKSNHV